MSKLVLHSNYSDGESTVQLGDVCNGMCFVNIRGAVIHMSLDDFLSRYQLVDAA